MYSPCPNCGAAAASVREMPDGATWASCGGCGFNHPVQKLGAGPYQAPPGAAPHVPEWRGAGGHAPSAVPQAVPVAGTSGSRRGLFGCLIGGPGALIGLLVPVVFLFCPKACASMDESHAVALAELRECARARELLGDDIDAAWVGMSSGEASYGGRSGNANWSLTVSGSEARGDYDFAAVMQNGRWSIVSATLYVDDATVSVPGGCGSPTVVSPASAGTGAEAAGRGAGAGSCDRLDACCASGVTSERSARQLCETAPMLRMVETRDQTCEQVRASIAQLVRAGGGDVPAACR